VPSFLSAKRIALSFEGTPDVPADLRKRELVVPAHSYGQRFCKRSIEEEVSADSCKQPPRAVLPSFRRGGHTVFFREATKNLRQDA